MAERQDMIAFGRDDVVVFHAAVPAAAETIDRLRTLLTDEERARADRFMFARDANLFVTAHALLRTALWRTTGTADWQFSTNAFGKPELVPASGEPPLRFNLTHSNALTACAVCRGDDIGVDVEAIDDDFEFDEVAAQVFTARERAWLHALLAGERRAAFLCLWTLKESLMKGCGRGFSLAPTTFETTLEPLRFSNDVDRTMTSDQWFVEQRELLPGHWACVAIRRLSASVTWQSVDAAEMIRMGGAAAAAALAWR